MSTEWWWWGALALAIVVALKVVWATVKWTIRLIVVTAIAAVFAVIKLGLWRM